MFAPPFIGQIVSTKKEELLCILDNFNIQVWTLYDVQCCWNFIMTKLKPHRLQHSRVSTTQFQPTSTRLCCVSTNSGTYSRWMAQKILYSAKLHSRHLYSSVSVMTDRQTPGSCSWPTCRVSYIVYCSILYCSCYFSYICASFSSCLCLSFLQPNRSRQTAAHLQSGSARGFFLLKGSFSLPSMPHAC